MALGGAVIGLLGLFLLLLGGRYLGFALGDLPRAGPGQQLGALGLGLLQPGLGRGQVGLGHLDVGFGGLDVGSRRGQLGRAGLAVHALGHGQLLDAQGVLGLPNGQRQFGRVQLGQHVAGGDRLAAHGVDVDDRPAEAEGEGDQRFRLDGAGGVDGRGDAVAGDGGLAQDFKLLVGGRLPSLHDEVDAGGDKSHHQDGEKGVPEITRHRLFPTKIDSSSRR